MREVEVRVNVTYTIPDGAKVGKKEIEKLRQLALADLSHVAREVGTHMGKRLVDIQIDGF
jgi:hypothetical protein